MEGSRKWKSHVSVAEVLVVAVAAFVRSDFVVAGVADVEGLFLWEVVERDDVVVDVVALHVVAAFVPEFKVVVALVEVGVEVVEFVCEGLDALIKFIDLGLIFGG